MIELAKLAYVCVCSRLASEDIEVLTVSRDVEARCILKLEVLGTSNVNCKAK